MGRYKKYHDVVADPITSFVDAICGTITKKTVLIDKKTGKRVEGYGRSYEESDQSDRKAWKKLHKK